MKRILAAVLLLSSFAAKAQKVESIHVNLYTDSLKKGTYNYINVDGLMSSGRYQPLDSTNIAFSCGQAKFFGNSLFIPADFNEEKVNIRVALKGDDSKYKEFVMYIKKSIDPPLRSESEVLNDMKGKRKKGS